MTKWDLIKDILLTGTGIAVIISQVLSRSPSDVLLATGLALTVPSVAAHTKALLSAHGGGPSSPSSPPHGPSPSSPSREVPGDE